MNIDSAASGDAVPERPLWEQRRLASGERLQKVLARVGYGSRRDCEQLIADRRVLVNGVVAELGRRVDCDSDEVRVDGKLIGVRPDLVYYVLNKPPGVICTASDPHHPSTILDLVPRHPRVFTVGRLDKESEGLIFLTNDGGFAQALSHPSMGVEKEYLVEVASDGRSVSPRAISRLRRGVHLDDGVTLPAVVSEVHPGVLRIVIHEGRNRQVRRMCDAVGYSVQRLVRTRIGRFREATLEPGHFRELTPHEVVAILSEVHQHDELSEAEIEIEE